MSSHPDSQITEQASLVIAAANTLAGLSRVSPQLVELGLIDLGEDYRQWCNMVCQHGGENAVVHGQVLDHEQVSDLEQIIAAHKNNTVFCADTRNLRVLESLAKAYPSARFVFLYSQLEEALRYVVDGSLSTSERVDLWKSAGEQLIRLHRRFRDRSLLINAEQLLEHPQSFVSLASRINLELKHDAHSVSREKQDNTVERFVAQQILKEQPKLKALSLELEASAHPLVDVEPYPEVSPVEVNNVLDQWRKVNLELRTDLESSTSELESLNDKIRLMQAQQEELAVSRDHVRKQRDEIDLRFQELQKTITAVEDREKQLQTGAEEQKEENELLLLQLHQVQEELETTFLENQKLIQEKESLASSNDEVKLLQSQLRDLQSAHEEMSKSRDHVRQQRDELDLEFKDTYQQLSQAKEQAAQLRGQTKEQEEENELLLLQLHQVQEELEHYYLKSQELVASLDEERLEAQKKQDRILQWLEAEYSSAPPSSSLASLFRRKDKKQQAEEKNIRLIESSGLFDKEWYIEHSPDVAEKKLHPIKHYLRYGAAEGRNPSALFDTNYYMESNPDVATSNINPLVHYIRFGHIERRPTVKPQQD
jgi:hypothetical protein